MGICCCVSHQEALSIDYPTIRIQSFITWWKWQKLLKRYIFPLVITKWPCDDTLYLSHVILHNPGMEPGSPALQADSLPTEL